MILYERDIKRMEEIRSYIASNLRYIPAIHDLCVRFNIGKSTLRRHFYYQYNETIQDFCLRKRMHEAHCLLNEKRLGVSDVAHKLGYKNRTTFTHAFTKFFGKTPSELLRNRKQAGNTGIE
jgi:AraC family transcriptional activator of pyochelin receptor